MDKLQAGLCTAHKHTEEIYQIIDVLESHINRNECDKRILENLAIININLPTIKFALENILDISGVVVTTDIDENGMEFTRYLEDAKVEPDSESKEDNGHGIDPNQQDKKS